MDLHDLSTIYRMGAWDGVRPLPRLDLALRFWLCHHVPGGATAEQANPLCLNEDDLRSWVNRTLPATIPDEAIAAMLVYARSMLTVLRYYAQG